MKAPVLRPDSLYGVKTEGWNIELDTNYFTCCGGDGWQMIGDGVKRCSLHERWQRLQNLWHRAERVWFEKTNEPKLIPMLADWDLFLKRVRASHQTRIRKQALGLMNVSRQKGVMSPLWSLGLYATWYYGMRVEVVTLGSEMIPFEGFPEILIVENVDDLWKESNVFQLSYCIQYAYQALIPLCIDVVQTKSKDNAAKVSSLSRKVSALKTKPTLSWLDAQTAAVLRKTVDVDLPFVSGKNEVDSQSPKRS